MTQRVSVVAEYSERRDCLDQAWPRFLRACGLLPFALPNVIDVALALCNRMSVSGFVLTGGDDLAALGGEAPERDALDNALLDLAETHGLPVIGVCRGMQVMQQRYGIPLRPVEGHVTPRQTIKILGEPKVVNSYHRFAAFQSREPLDVWAVADDGVVKAVRHTSLPMIGIMWHPERSSPLAPDDLALFRRIFQVVECGP